VIGETEVTTLILLLKTWPWLELLVVFSVPEEVLNDASVTIPITKLVNIITELTIFIHLHSQGSIKTLTNSITSWLLVF